MSSAFDDEMKAEDMKLSAVAQAVSDILPLASVSERQPGGVERPREAEGAQAVSMGTTATALPHDDFPADYEVGAVVFDLANAISALDRQVPDLDLEDGAHVLVNARQAYLDLKTVLDILENRVGKAMDSKTVTVENVGTLERHRDKSYTKWDREALLRDVLDSRLADENTGEVVDESPLDKVLKVWNLGAPRRTVLRQRGLQPDEYAEVEDKGAWKVQIR